MVATCWTILIATASSSPGEPVLRSTTPGNAETVKSPDQVLLTFDRPVPAGLATVRILDPYGDQIVFERPVRAAGHPDTISVPMPKKRYEGTYAVSWTLPSSGLEPISGAFTFDVSSPIEPLGVPEIETKHDPYVAVFHTAARFAAVAALVLLVGVAFLVAAIWPAGAHSRTVRRIVIGAWCGLVVATLAVLASFGPYAAWAPLSGAFDPRLLSGTVESDAGAALLTRLYVLIPATLGLAQLMTAPTAETTRERWIRGGAVLGCAAAVVATWSLPTTRSPLPVAVDIVLLTTIAVAVGGLVLLWFRGDGSVVSRFFRLASVCAGLLVVTGGYLGLRHGVAATSYGWLLLGLLALAALLVATGLLLRRRHRAHGGKKKKGSALVRPRGTAVIATGIAGLILAGTAVLVVAEPPRTAHAESPSSPPFAIRDQAAPARFPFDTGKPGGQGSLDLVVVPTAAEHGQIHFDIHVTALDGQDATNNGVSVTAVLERPDGTAAPMPVSLASAAPGYSVGQATVQNRGHWALALTVRAADGSRQAVVLPIDVT
ncbi:MAG TPA: copper resistance CopC family protein [Amycolatopsis sp.]|nr:copper resistance CopC family protein [Amycolatopsis sp.]